MIGQRIRGFLPSSSGLHFDNIFAHAPVAHIRVGTLDIPIGDAAGGLCGGMVFTVRDFHEANLAMLPTTDSPLPDTPLFDYIAGRLMNSLQFPIPAKYYEWMNLRNDDSLLFFHGVAWRTIKQEWPAVKATLDAGHLAPIGLVTVHSADPRDFGQCHQVLVYGYDLNPVTQDLSLHIYDPNEHDNDSIRLTLNLSKPSKSTPIGYLRPVRGFFQTPYTAVDPAALTPAQTA